MSSDATPSVTSMREARQARARRAQAAASGPPLTTFIASWQLALEAAAKSKQTVRGYTDSARWLCKFLVEHDMPADVEGVDAQHIRAYLVHEEQRTSAVSAAHHFRNIRVFFGWLASEGERENPDRVEAPKVTKKAKSFFTERRGPCPASRLRSWGLAGRIMTVRHSECKVQVHASRMSARKGTHGQPRALALRDTAQPTVTTGSGPEVMPRG